MLRVMICDGIPCLGLNSSTNSVDQILHEISIEIEQKEQASGTLSVEQVTGALHAPYCQCLSFVYMSIR